ncbi:AraC family transcriptional regulator [Ferruginibacter sp. HRS2-29]|uniref:helix-turn-helix domain-containing protein n=1 Tax=Ferruginibacter sp. HRS2-29 TaxID=2487334 RepID=UPI0020CCD869|nr:AraC family transcriptional regulator [Ferruginibacter sp. HRS2-29]MCP9749733.1 AraC family transcriptional regulator [Ferruginibacter sp. HRS2-29]
MQKENIYEPFSIKFVTADDCPRPGHGHNFFELVYVISGTGTQSINDNTFHYRAGHMFLITPEDSHSFEIETTTEFFFLRFTDIYLKNSSLLSDNIQRLEFILHNANHRPGCILKNHSDKPFVGSTVEAIRHEFENKDLYNRELVQQMVNTLIIIVARNIARYLPEQVNMGTEEKAMDILQYIQQNIYYPEKLKASSISSNFAVSEAYIGRYFKRHANETLQQYITNYKTKMIEHRLQFSDKRLNEIAGEFGFTDESHFNKFFRKQSGQSPKAYRKEMREAV